MGAPAVLAALAVVLLLLALPSGGSAAPLDALAPGLNVAVQDDRLPVVAEAGIPGRLDLIAGTGVRVTRVDVLWDAVAPTRPSRPADPGDRAYRWARYDAVVDGLTARGVAVILNVYRSPSWANGRRDHRWAPGESAYAAFMTALARRYDGRTPDRAGRVHGPVEMFEPWNEPNLPGFLMPQWRTEDGVAVPASPRIYAGLLRRAHAAIKAVQPDAWVIGVSGGPSGSDNPPAGSVGIVTFVRALAALGPPADAFAQHLYPAVGPTESVAMPSYARLPELIGELDAIRPGLPILITEFGWTTSPTPVRASHVDEVAQERYLREALDALAAIPRVRLAVWFNLDDNASWTSGLRRADGAPKSSWTTFSALPKLGYAPAPPPPPSPVVIAPPPPAPPPARVTARGRLALAGVGALRRGRVRAGLACAGVGPCRAEARLVVRGRVVARRVLVLRPGGRLTFSLAVPPARRRALAGATARLLVVPRGTGSGPALGRTLRT